MITVNFCSDQTDAKKCWTLIWYGIKRQTSTGADKQTNRTSETKGW